MALAISPQTQNRSFPSDWRSFPVKSTSTAAGQSLNTRIGYSITPRWSTQVTGGATAKGVAQLNLNGQIFTVPVEKGQSAKVTAQRLQAQLKAAGFETQLSGNPPASPAQVRELTAKAAADRTALQAPNLSAADKERLETDLEVATEQINNKGYYELSFGKNDIGYH
jgi:hypothetical protein